MYNPFYTDEDLERYETCVSCGDLIKTGYLYRMKDICSCGSRSCQETAKLRYFSRYIKEKSLEKKLACTYCGEPIEVDEYCYAENGIYCCEGDECKLQFMEDNDYDFEEECLSTGLFIRDCDKD